MSDIEIINHSFEIPNNWKKIKIKYLLDSKVTDGPHETPNFIEDGIPFLSVDSIVEGKLVFEGCRHISKEDHEKFKLKCFPQKNDIFMGKAASIGKIAIVDVDFEFSIWSPLALIRPNQEKILPKFLEYSLKSDYSQDQIDLYATSNTQKNISMDDIPRIELFVPNLEEQGFIVNYLDKKILEIERKIEKNKKLISLLDEKKIAIINKAVTKGLQSNSPMKDSGIDWIGEIPIEWNISKVKHCFYRKNMKANQENPTVLSLARDGVKIRDISTGEGQIAESYYHYNPVQPGDLLLNPMDLVSGANCSLSEVEGVISPAYINLKAKNGINPKYYDYYFKLQYWSMALFAHGKGVSFENRWTINNETLMNYVIPVPNEETQNNIVDFLEINLLKIDKILDKIKEHIKILEEYKNSLIHHAVTGKIDVRDEI